MDYEAFKEYIKSHIMEYLPEEYQDAEISISQHVKNNDLLLDGLHIRKQDSIMSPVVYMNSAYKDYQEGKDMEDVMLETANVYKTALTMKEGYASDVALKDIGNYDSIKDRIYCRLVNRTDNAIRLQDIPFTPMEDLAVTYHIRVKKDTTGIHSISITNDMMASYGLETEELHEQAMTNMETLSPTVIRPLSEMLMEMMLPTFMDDFGLSREEAREKVREVIPDSEFHQSPELICVSNDMGINGAASIISPDVRQRVAEMVGGDYYVLPSSVHEVLVFPKTEDISSDDLRKMVKEVNGSSVSEEERLSDSIYEYNAKERTFHLADNVLQMDAMQMDARQMDTMTMGTMMKTPEQEIQKHSAKMR